MRYDRRRQLAYREVLRRVHEDLRPRRYLEIGVHYGHSLVLCEPGTRIVGVDPRPELRRPLPTGAELVERTSDDFFSEVDVHALLGGAPDLTFIDGLHLFEYALRDFRNAERSSHPGSAVLLHDCAPPPEWAERGIRSGDVWKVMLALRDYRPDLQVSTLLAPPSGLGLVTGLDPQSSVLWDRYDEIIERYSSVPYSEVMGDALPFRPVDTEAWRSVRAVLPAPFRSRTPASVARATVRRNGATLRRGARVQAQRIRRRLGGAGRVVGRWS